MKFAHRSQPSLQKLTFSLVIGCSALILSTQFARAQDTPPTPPQARQLRPLLLPLLLLYGVLGESISVGWWMAITATTQTIRQSARMEINCTILTTMPILSA